eukprot:10729001-Alexandrium_andersonii.AAC.1
MAPDYPRRNKCAGAPLTSLSGLLMTSTCTQHIRVAHGAAVGPIAMAPRAKFALPRLSTGFNNF